MFESRLPLQMTTFCGLFLYVLLLNTKKRETIWAPATHEEDLNQGITEQIKEVIEYDENGNGKIVFKNKELS